MLFQQISLPDFITSDPGCGTKKVCYPANCDESSACDFALSWEDAQEYVDFELTAKLVLPGSRNYMGFGLADAPQMVRMSSPI